MIDLLEHICNNATINGKKPAISRYYFDVDEVKLDKTASLTWKELIDAAYKIAVWMRREVSTKTPVVVFGHKNPLMIACFLGSVLSGRGYCPIDSSTPLERVSDIVSNIKPELIFAFDDLNTLKTDAKVTTLGDIEAVAGNTAKMPTEEEINNLPGIKEDDVWYIIFTSGSTGKPKGVQITAANLRGFIDWGVTLLPNKDKDEQLTFMNQAPFSFDLSVMDTYLSLYTGGNLVLLNKETTGDMKCLMKTLSVSKINVWVSTPSFADLCLPATQLCEEEIPSIRTFLFCGEPLTKTTVKKLYERFPNSLVVNTYGPTESTVAVTGVPMDEKAFSYEALPVGYARKGTIICIEGEDGNALSDGEKGEIIICGDTVSIGYMNALDLTEEKFVEREIDGTVYPAYHTGDVGYLDNGLLFCCGRMDHQIKLHGYRMELDDIENNILKLDEISWACVVPNKRNGKISSLTAYVVKGDGTVGDFAEAQELKKRLKEFLPEYMIPKKITFRDSLPLTGNGKVDRKALTGEER